MKTKTSSVPWVTKPIVPEEVYTDRAEFLEYFHHAASEAPHRRTASTVLLGQRRMGKTEIFRCVVNRLFFEKNTLVMRMWLFAHNGLTGEAEAFAEKHGILWSARKQFDELLAHLGLRKLPNI